MKITYLILSILFFLFGGINLLRYGLDYAKLTDYGKGFVFGNLFFLLLAFLFMYLYFKRKSRDL